jgi:hypothetical protein
MMIFGCSKEFRFPARTASLKVFASRMTLGRKNLSSSSWLHCLRRFAGHTTNKVRRRSAQRCASKIPASIVFPRPTSSARIAPFESGERKQRERLQSGGDLDRLERQKARMPICRRCQNWTASSARGQRAWRDSRSCPLALARDPPCTNFRAQVTQTIGSISLSLITKGSQARHRRHIAGPGPGMGRNSSTARACSGKSSQHISCFI